MRYLLWAAAVVCACGTTGKAWGQKPADAVAVEPDELERRSDLVGRLVVVDDHVKYYVPRNGSEPDELQLKRTPITFQVPRSLRPTGSTRLSAVVVRGVLAREEGRLVCQVSELKSVSGDLDRLERGLASLSPKDFETRKAWALWAERRASAFKDQPLLERAKVIEGEALRIESDMKRMGVDAPAEWLAMAQEARQRQVPESESGALGHRAFRAKLAAATGEAELKTLIEQIEAFFPARRPIKSPAGPTWPGGRKRTPTILGVRIAIAKRRHISEKASIGGSGPTPLLDCSRFRPHRTCRPPLPRQNVRPVWFPKDRTFRLTYLKKQRAWLGRT